MFSFCLRVDNLEFSHINQLLFSLVFVPVCDHCSDDSESLIVEENDDSVGKPLKVRQSAFHRFVSSQLLRGNDDSVGENGNSAGKPLQSTFHRFVSSSRRQLLRGFSSFTQSM